MERWGPSSTELAARGGRTIIAVLDVRAYAHSHTIQDKGPQV